VALARTPANQIDLDTFFVGSTFEQSPGGRVIPAIIISDWEEENCEVSNVIKFFVAVAYSREQISQTKIKIILPRLFTIRLGPCPLNKS